MIYHEDRRRYRPPPRARVVGEKAALLSYISVPREDPRIGENPETHRSEAGQSSV